MPLVIQAVGKYGRKIAFHILRDAEWLPQTEATIDFSEEAVDPIWKLLADLDEQQLEPDERDLRYHLVAVCIIMGRTFPFFGEWHEAALRDNWGRFGIETGRVADNLKPDDIGPKWSEN